MTAEQLADLLLQSVRAQDFGATPDRLAGGAPVAQFPSLDLALAVFPRGAAPVWANVLFSREHPDGVVARIGADGGPVRNVRFLADLRDAAGESMAWQPGSDWNALDWRTLWGNGPHRFVAPYPASLLKLMVAAGVAICVEEDRIDWPAPDLQAMITESDNDATDRLVALLHRHRRVDALNARLADCGLPTLRLLGTTTAGGWRNADGAGVGMIHMTAWDSVRLLWLLDTDAPPAPWLPAGRRLLGEASCRRLHGWLLAQRRNEVLSSGSLTGLPGWVRGIPETVDFAHKTGTTDNYASDAGIVRGRAPAQRHYIVALLSNLGRRYAAHEQAATTWRVPVLGAAIDAALTRWLEDPAA